MSDADFDIIVVGSRVRGRGGGLRGWPRPASRRARGGARQLRRREEHDRRAHLHATRLKEVFPDFEAEAPLERKITHERIAMLNRDSEMTDRLHEPASSREKGKDSYSVLRGPFDQWLAEQGRGGRRRVHLRHRRGGTLEGRGRQGRRRPRRRGRDHRARSSIVAEGVNTLLCPSAASATRAPAPHQMAVGIKEVFELPARRDRGPLPGARGRGRGNAVRRRLHARQAWAAASCTPTRTRSRLGLVATISHGRRRRERHAGLPDARGLQEPPGGRADHPRREAGRALRATWCPRAATTWCPQYVFDGGACGRRGGRPLHEHGLPGARHGLRRGERAHGRPRRPSSAHRRGRHVSAAGLASYKAKMEDSFVIQDLAHLPQVARMSWRSWDAHVQRVSDHGGARSSTPCSAWTGARRSPSRKRMMPIVKQRGPVQDWPAR